MFTSMRKLGTTVWNDHFCNGDTPEEWTYVPMVVEGDVIQYDAFPIIETNVELSQ